MNPFIKYCLYFLLIIPSLVMGQDVESFWGELKDRIKNEPIRADGSISLNTNVYQVNGIENRQDPFTWGGSVALNLDILGIKAPFSYYYADKNDQFNIPSYKVAGISPSYKWIKLHGGNRSLDFSEFTLGSHSFDGGGFELTPGSFYVGGMYGQLLRAQKEDLDNINSIEPVYRRMGFGGKIGYKKEEDEIFLMLFKGWDDENSIGVISNKFDVLPNDNVAISIMGKKKIGDKFNLSLEFARTALNRDKSLNDIEDNQNVFLGGMFGLFDPNSSVIYANAYNAGVQYDLTKFFQVGINYKRVNPGYRTLGSLYFNDDAESVSANTTFNTNC